MQLIEFITNSNNRRFAVNPKRIGGIEDGGSDYSYTRIIVDGIYVEIRGSYQEVLSTLRAAGAKVKVILDNDAFDIAPAGPEPTRRKKK